MSSHGVPECHRIVHIHPVADDVFAAMPEAHALMVNY